MLKIIFISRALEFPLPDSKLANVNNHLYCISDSIEFLEFAKVENSVISTMLNNFVENIQNKKHQYLVVSEHLQSPETIQYIGEIEILPKNIDKYLHSLEQYIAETFLTLKNEDDYYDFFPELLDTFAQICIVLNKRDYYIDSLNRLKQNTELKENLFNHSFNEYSREEDWSLLIPFKSFE